MDPLGPQCGISQTKNTPGLTGGAPGAHGVTVFYWFLLCCSLEFHVKFPYGVGEAVDHLSGVRELGGASPKHWPLRPSAGDERQGSLSRGALGRRNQVVRRLLAVFSNLKLAPVCTSHLHLALVKCLVQADNIGERSSHTHPPPGDLWQKQKRIFPEKIM